MSSDPSGQGSVFLPNQVEVIQKVFDDLVRETWFDDTPQNREQLAALVVHTFRTGKTHPFSLLETCREQARERFWRR